MNTPYLKQIILVLNLVFISFSFSNNPTITGIYPAKGTDQNGHISILGSNFEDVKQVLFNTNMGIIAVPQIVSFKEYIKVYFVPKDAIITYVSIAGVFGIASSKEIFMPIIPSITGLFYSNDKEGRSYVILLGENLNFIEKCNFKTTNNESANSVVNFFGAFAQVYVPRNAKNGTLSISGSSFGNIKTDYEFKNATQHIPEIVKYTDTDENNILANDISIYPNPYTNGELRIENGVGALQIYNAQCAIVYSSIITSEITTLNLNLTKGIYLVKVGNNSQKLVVW